MSYADRWFLVIPAALITEATVAPFLSSPTAFCRCPLRFSSQIARFFSSADACWIDLGIAIISAVSWIATEVQADRQ